MNDLDVARKRLAQEREAHSLAEKVLANPLALEVVFRVLGIEHKVRDPRRFEAMILGLIEDAIGERNERLANLVRIVRESPQMDDVTEDDVRRALVNGGYVQKERGWWARPGSAKEE